MALSHEEDGSMSRKRHRPEEIVGKLRQVEVLTAQGRSVAEAIRSIGGGELRGMIRLALRRPAAPHRGSRRLRRAPGQGGA
jgi:putative transposase